VSFGAWTSNAGDGSWSEVKEIDAFERFNRVEECAGGMVL